MKTKKRKRYSYVWMLGCILAVACCLPSKMVLAATTGTVTASKLNVRSKVTTSSTSLGTVVKGTQVTILSSTKDKKNVTWYKITVLIREKKVTGYVASKYISKNKTYRYVMRDGKVTASALNIRASTSTSSKIMATVKKGTKVKAYKTLTVKGITWYKVKLTVKGKTIYGYVYKKYIALDKITRKGSTYVLGAIKSKTAVMYKYANVYTTRKVVLNQNNPIIILGGLTVGSTKWYKVKARVNKTVLFGYVKSSTVTKLKGTTSSTISEKGTIIKKATARKLASTVAGKVNSLVSGLRVTVRGSVTVQNVVWYKCTYTINKTSKTAYVLASYVSLSGDVKFEEGIAKFPSSYKSYLRKLHETYPKWKFVAINTGLDWDTIIKNQSYVGRNTIQSNVPKGGSVSAYSVPFSYLSTASGAYDWATDTYTLCDGSNWYTADTRVIEYYMDPRNSLNEESMLQFITLAYDDTQKVDVVSKILKNTFMEASFQVVDQLTTKKVEGNYAQTFMQAGKLAGTSPYFLAQRSRQELGVNGSGSVSGTYEGYEGYYNFYNIGANDSALGMAIANGLRWASTGTTYERPWTNPIKSIVGGAKYIASSYIQKGQNTSYFQKFNVVYYPYYAHQYMTSIQAPYQEAKSKYASYKAMGIISDSNVFYIPVYENMPSKVCQLPKTSGNPNSYLKSVSVKNGSEKLTLTPSFEYKTTSYTMVVPKEVENVTIDMTPVSKFSTISGGGTYTLTSGETKTVTLTCTAQNKTVTQYKIKIVRL